MIKMLLNYQVLRDTRVCVCVQMMFSLINVPVDYSQVFYVGYTLRDGDSRTFYIFIYIYIFRIKYIYIIISNLFYRINTLYSVRTSCLHTQYT